MKILKIAWAGSRTDRFVDLSKMFGKVMGLKLVREENDFSTFITQDGSKVEIFGPKCDYNKHFTTGPVVGFLVDDIYSAEKELRDAKIEVIDTVKVGKSGNKWLHFRAPDGNVYELLQD